MCVAAVQNELQSAPVWAPHGWSCHHVGSFGCQIPVKQTVGRSQPQSAGHCCKCSSYVAALLQEVHPAPYCRNLLIYMTHGKSCHHAKSLCCHFVGHREVQSVHPAIEGLAWLVASDERLCSALQPLMFSTGIYPSIMSVVILRTQAIG